MKIYLLPGLDGTGELFYPLLSALSEETQSVIVRYQDEVLFEEYLETVTALIPDKDVILVAESFSGPIALALIARNPSRFKFVILSATFAISPFHEILGITKYLPSFVFGPYRKNKAMINTFCLNGCSNDDLATKTLSVVRSLPASTTKSRLELLAGIDMRPVLSQITIPILYLRALHDRLVSPRLSQQLIDGLPNVVVQPIDGPHMLLQANPIESVKAITQHLPP